MKRVKILHIVLISQLAFFVCACEKNRVTENQNETVSKVSSLKVTDSLFTIETEVFDGFKANSIELKISSPSKNLIDEFMSTNKISIKVSDKLKPFKDTVRERSTPGTILEIVTGSDLEFEVLSTSFETNIKSFQLQFTRLKGSKAVQSLTTQTYKGPAGFPYVHVEHYYSSQLPLIYMASGYLNCWLCFWQWYDGPGEWMNLYPGDTQPYCNTNSYKVGAKVKADDHSVYNVSFQTSC